MAAPTSTHANATKMVRIYHFKIFYQLKLFFFERFNWNFTLRRNQSYITTEVNYLSVPSGGINIKFISKFNRTQSPCAISQHHLEVSMKTPSPKTQCLPEYGPVWINNLFAAYNTSTCQDKHFCISCEAQTILGLDVSRCRTCVVSNTDKTLTHIITMNCAFSQMISGVGVSVSVSVFHIHYFYNKINKI